LDDSIREIRPAGRRRAGSSLFQSEQARVPEMGAHHDYDEGEGLNPVWLANSYLRRRKYDECIAICTGILEKNPYDQVRARRAPAPSLRRFSLLHSRRSSLPPPPPPARAQAVWYLKARALTLKNWIDDDEIEEEVRARPRNPLRPPRVRWRFQTGEKHLPASRVAV
jgi:hypothetical protein